MSIRIGNNTDYLEITDIVPEGQEFGYNSKSVEYLRGTLCLKISGVKTDIRASFMIGEIKKLQADLEQLYQTLKFKFEFQNLEHNVLLKFSPTPNGRIEIEGELNTPGNLATVEFKFETDQTFLPSTIKQIKDALDL